MGAGRNKLFLIAGACTLFVLLYFAPKVIAKKPSDIGLESDSKATAVNSNLDVFLNLSIKGLEENQKSVFNRLQAEKKSDSLIVFWDKLKRPDLAAYFAENKAKIDLKEEAWLLAGKRYYSATQFTQDKSEVPVLIQCALRCFNNCIQLNKNNNEAKILKASCIVEGAGNPMDGIAILKEVEKTDSNNVQLQLTFAFFSVKSGQLDKAIERFNKVLKVDTNYIEAYLHLADVYERQDKPEKIIEMLEVYSSKTDDPTSKAEIDKYIQQIKTNINK